MQQQNISEHTMINESGMIRVHIDADNRGCSYLGLPILDSLSSEETESPATSDPR